MPGWQFHHITGLHGITITSYLVIIRSLPIVGLSWAPQNPFPWSKESPVTVWRAVSLSCLVSLLYISQPPPARNSSFAMRYNHNDYDP